MFYLQAELICSVSMNNTQQDKTQCPCFIGPLYELAIFNQQNQTFSNINVSHTQSSFGDRRNLIG